MIITQTEKRELMKELALTKVKILRKVSYKRNLH